MLFQKTKTIIPDPVSSSTTAGGNVTDADDQLSLLTSSIESEKTMATRQSIDSVVDSGRERKTTKRTMSSSPPTSLIASSSGGYNPKSTKKGHFSLRGKKNEDRVVSGLKVLEKDGSSVELHVVIDGHGGFQTAEFLERELPLRIRTLCSERTAKLDIAFKSKDEWRSLLKEAFAQCSDDWDKNAVTHSEKKAGAVVTLVLISGAHCFVAHVGDGKVVASCGENFQELTLDHRADNPSERARIESCGGCVVNDRVRGVLAPSRAFGDLLVRTDVKGTVNNSVIQPDPQLVSFDATCPGFLVLGTDGLFDVLPGNLVTTTVSILLAKDPDANVAARYLAEQASVWTDDDISVIVVTWS